MGKVRAGRQPRKTAAEKRAAQAPAPPRFDIPYFAHEQLDPKRYPENFGIPVGGPPVPGAHIVSNRPVDSESEFDFDLDSDGEWVAEKDRNKKPANDRPEHSSKSYKKFKQEGGRPPIAKKVVPELDSDDEIILQMKQARFTDKDIAARLQGEGRIIYNEKSISTRYYRMKMVLRKYNDELLDADLTDWHDGDDEVLVRAIEKAADDVERVKREADAKLWSFVANHMKTIKPVTNFSHKACRERFERLQNGTAKPTPESVEDPDENVKRRVESRAEKEAKLAALEKIKPQSLTRRELLTKHIRQERGH